MNSLLRLIKLLFVLLSANLIAGTSHAADKTTEVESTNKVQDLSLSDQKSAEPREQVESKNTKKAGPSIKMIVGGQSTDGQAKRVDLPIEE